MQDYARQQRERLWQPIEPVMARDFPVGIMGLGVLGRQAADLLVAMGYPVHAWSRSVKSVPGVTAHVGPTSLADFLAAVRVLVNFLPLTAETRGLIAAPLLARLKPGSYLVNLARGGHVVEADVLAALDCGQLGGAMLDVFENEPLPADSPLWHHPAVVITPHVAAVTLASDAAAQVIENLRRLATGRDPRGLVDRQRGY
jgi:glyoxylate/hydroxypyruvate reductase A